MAFPDNNYAPPGVYTQTNFDSPVASAITATRIPVLIGEGSEALTQSNLSVVRGSSSTVDQQVVDENEAGRAVVSISAAGAVTLGNFDGLITKFQVRNFPITNGDGTGTTSNSRNAVVVTLNGSPIVVQSVDGLRGIITLAQAPSATDIVRCTYYFHRRDTLFTDNVSEQITAGNAVLYGAQGVTPTTGNFVVNTNNNTFVVTVLNSATPTTVTVTLPIGNLSATVVANTLTAQVSGLTASTYINNFGLQAIQLSATTNILIGSGSANDLLGFVNNQTTTRNAVFYTFQGPIVDGSGGGVTTTDPANVIVKVNGTAVVATAVNGTTRAVTLPYAPADGSTVTITYWQNTWQDTFDYLANIGITNITYCGAVPGPNGGAPYINEVDFVLYNDTIVWGTALLVGSSTTQVGSTAFGSTQISGSLVDYQFYGAECREISSTQFQLPYQPTTGNGRNSPLGSSLFNSVSNGRIDLPTNRPDLVTAYWGYSFQDALERGSVAVTKVDSATSTITLAEPVPAGASVYASFYYNLLVDKEYLLTVALPGVGSVGTYTVADADGNATYSATFNPNTKSAGLTGITLNFPSGSEYYAGARFQSSSSSLFTGPINEIITVTTASLRATPAAIAVLGNDPYYFIENASSNLFVKFDSLGGMSAVNLAGPNLGVGAGLNAGIPATLVGSPVVYDDTTGGTSYTLDATNNVLVVEVDGVQISAEVNPAASLTVDAFATALNHAGGGGAAAALGGATNVTLTFDATTYTAFSQTTNYYVGWEVIMGADPGAGVTAGQKRTVTASSSTGGTTTITVSLAWTAGGGATPDIAQVFHMVNPATVTVVKGATKFANSFVVTANEHDRLTVRYVGQTTGASSAVLTLTPATYATATALAAQVQAQLDLAAGFNGAAGNNQLPQVNCTADGDGRLVFSFRRNVNDSTGYFEFIEQGIPLRDFAVIAGLDAEDNSQTQAKYYHGTFAKRYTTATGGPLLYDRLVIRGRIAPGLGQYNGSSSDYASMAAFNVESQCGIEVLGGVGNTKAGLTTNQMAEATNKATVQPASLKGDLIQSDGQIAPATANTAGEYAVYFYDGNGANSKNDEFEFTVDGFTCTVTFTSSAGGTLTPLGDNTVAATSGSSSIISQIQAALAAIGGAPFGNLAAVRASQMVRRDGVGLRLTSITADTQSAVQIGNLSANATLGFTAGQSASRSTVSASKLVSALMGNNGTAYPVQAAAANSFAAEGVAAVVTDAGGLNYLYLESNSTGTASRIEFVAAATFDALRQGTGLGVSAGEYVTGEAALNGFFVTSSSPNGSGSANTSVLNSGTGQDGVCGQTYVDDVTGFTFTLLPREGGLSYPTGQTFRFVSSDTFVTNGTIPVQIPGVEVTVTDTVGTAVGNVATVSTFKRGGNEPAIGDVYYVSYDYTKQDFTPSLYSKVATIEQVFGPTSPDNPVSLAAYLAILNGAVLVGIAQTQKAAGSDFATVATYAEVLDSLSTPLPGNVKPDIIVPLRGDSTEFFQYLSRNVSVQSSIRYQNERTAICGVSAGTTPSQMQTLAQLISNTRMRFVYPDTVTLTITNAVGTRQEYLVEGFYMAAALAGNRSAAAIDVATPWTNAQLVGFTQLGRKLDAVQQNQTAIRGVTILEDAPPFIKVRQGLTTDMTNVLTKLPTIIQISDYVQQNARVTLANFIGIKFLPGVLSQIEGRLSMMFKNMVAAQIITAYTGIRANVAPDDPTVANVEAFYQPVFPLLYIVITFNLRSNLAA